VQGQKLSLLLAVASRYGALAVQFLIVVLVSRQLSKAEAGAYFMIFGAVTSTYCLAGLGIPDGLVKSCSEAIAHERRELVRPQVGKAAMVTLISSVAMLAGLIGVGVALRMPLAYLGAFAGWWMGYAVVFFCGQALVAIGKESLGAFLFYTATNLFMIVTTAPYLLLHAHPTLSGALVASLAAACLAAVICVASLTINLLKWPAGEVKAQVLPTARLGAMIAIARLFQAVIYWIPAWAIGAVRGPADAATVGAAGRLLIAASALIAAFRFSVRSRIVIAATKGDWEGIERMSRVIATIATSGALAALIGLFVIGDPIIALVFGHDYAAVGPVLAVLLIGAIGESFGGPVDEVLKLTGRPVAVLVGLMVAVALEAALAIWLAHYGVVAVAVAQAAAFCGMYGFQIYYLKRKTGALIVPYASIGALRTAMRA